MDPRKIRYVPKFPQKLYGGIWAAKVENNVDPLNIGRLQVRVPSIDGPDDLDVEQYEARTGIIFRHPQTNIPFGTTPSPNTTMPWAFPCLPYGTFVIPPIGEWVWVMFQDHDPNYPVWLGCWYQLNSPQEAGTDDFSRGSRPNPQGLPIDRSVFEVPVATPPTQFAQPRFQWKRALPANSNATTDPTVDAARIAEANVNPDIMPIIVQNPGVQFTYDIYIPVFTTTGNVELNQPVSTPPEANDYPVLEPNIKVIYRTPMGASMLVGEREQNQYVKLITAAGDILEFSSPFKRALNLDYAQRRITGDITNIIGNPTLLYELFAKMVDLTSFAEIVGQLGQQLQLSTNETTATVLLAGLNQSLTMTCTHMLQDNPTGELEWIPGDQTGTITVQGLGGMGLTMTTTGPAVAPVENGSVQNPSTTHIELQDGKQTQITVDSLAPQGGSQGPQTTQVQVKTFHGETISLATTVNGAVFDTVFQTRLSNNTSISATYDGTKGEIDLKTPNTEITLT
jgi:Type VI secretion system/phage-baseplate injector OB domain